LPAMLGRLSRLEVIERNSSVIASWAVRPFSASARVRDKKLLPLVDDVSHFTTTMIVRLEIPERQVKHDEDVRRHLTGVERDGHRKRALLALLNKLSTGDDTLRIEVERERT
jgi:hypothetical protein